MGLGRLEYFELSSKVPAAVGYILKNILKALNYILILGIIILSSFWCTSVRL